MNLFEKLGIWYAKKRLDKSLKLQTDRIKLLGKMSPVPAPMFGYNNILAHYGNPTAIGTVYAMAIVDGVVHQEEQQVLTETAKVRFPDGSIDLIKISYVRNHAPWQIKQ